MSNLLCYIIEYHHKPQVRSQFWIWGGAFFKKVDFFAFFLEKGGLFCVLSRRKWTILLAFLGENGLFCALLGGKWTILAKIVDHFGHFWTIIKVS